MKFIFTPPLSSPAPHQLGGSKSISWVVMVTYNVTVVVVVTFYVKVVAMVISYPIVVFMVIFYVTVVVVPSWSHITSQWLPW